jgi:hypothetical protein
MFRKIRFLMIANTPRKQQRFRGNRGRKARPMSRAIKIIHFTAIVVKNELGYVARCVELSLPNTYQNGSVPAKTQQGAIKNLKEAVAQWLEWQADDGVLARALDELGFVGTIDSDKTEVRIYSTKDLSLPLPKNWLRKKDDGERREGHAVN